MRDKTRLRVVYYMTCLGRAGKPVALWGDDDGGGGGHTLNRKRVFYFILEENTDESAIAVHRGGQPPGVLQRGDFGVQRRRAALHAHVVARAEAVACIGEQSGADGYAALGEAAFGFVERDGEAAPVVCVIGVADRVVVVRCGGGGGGGRFRRRRHDGGYVRGYVGDDDIDVDVFRHRHHCPFCDRGRFRIGCPIYD